MTATSQLRSTADGDAVRRISERVLRELELDPVEVELSLGLLDPLAELADGGEVMVTDVGDVAGGFGGVDLLVASVVPAVAWVLAAARGGAGDGADVGDGTDGGELVERSLAEVERAVRATRSPRAGEELPRLRAAVRSAVLAHLGASGGER